MEVIYMIAIYTRQSIEKKDSVSIETQIDICKKEINTINSGFKIYEDKGFSGKNIDRPAFQQLISEIKHGAIDTVIVYRLDRISRSVLDFANIIDILQQHNVNFISATERFDTSAPVGKAMLYIVMVFAQLERETIAERVKDNYYLRGETGAWGGGPAPLGYSNTKNIINGKKTATITQNNDIVTVIRIFNEYGSTDKSLSDIAKELRIDSNEMWNNIKLSRILHNPTYVQADVDIYHYYISKGCIIESDISLFNGINGINIYGKRDRNANKYNNLENQHIAVGYHKGIIPSELWLNCQNKLEKNIQIKNNGKGKHTWLTGLVKCGYCERALVVKKYKDIKYFSCSGRASGVCKSTPSTCYVNEIETLIYQKMLNYIKNFDECKLTTIKESNKLEANNLKAQLVKIENEINNIINNLALANPTLIEYANKKIDELDSKRKDIINKLNELNVTNDIEINIPQLDDWNNWSIELKRTVAKQLISKIFVFDEYVSIKWAY